MYLDLESLKQSISNREEKEEFFFKWGGGGGGGDRGRRILKKEMIDSFRGKKNTGRKERPTH